MICLICLQLVPLPLSVQSLNVLFYFLKQLHKLLKGYFADFQPYLCHNIKSTICKRTIFNCTLSLPLTCRQQSNRLPHFSVTLSKDAKSKEVRSPGFTLALGEREGQLTEFRFIQIIWLCSPNFKNVCFFLLYRRPSLMKILSFQHEKIL